MMVQSLLYFELRGAPTRDQKRLYGFSLLPSLDLCLDAVKISQKSSKPGRPMKSENLVQNEGMCSNINIIVY